MGTYGSGAVSRFPGVPVAAATSAAEFALVAGSAVEAVVAARVAGWCGARFGVLLYFPGLLVRASAVRRAGAAGCAPGASAAAAAAAGAAWEEGHGSAAAVWRASSPAPTDSGNGKAVPARHCRDGDEGGRGAGAR